MKIHLVSVLALALLACASCVIPAQAQNAGRVTQWKTFFAQVLPTVTEDFASIRGGKEAGHHDDHYYGVTASFDPSLIKRCSINSNVYWSLFCEDLPQYVGTSALSSLDADITAALPSSFTRTTDSDGYPTWKDGPTDIFLIGPQKAGDDWAISVGDNK